MDLRELAPELAALAAEPTGAVVARTVALQGFGACRVGEALVLVDDGRRLGGLLGGAVDDEVAAAADDVRSGAAAWRTVELDVHGPDAVAAGLTCGGRATVVVQPLDALPAELWPELATGPVALATPDGQPSVV